MTTLDFSLCLEDDTVLLRPLGEIDLEPLFEFTSQEDIWKFFTYDLRERPMFDEWVQPALQHSRLQFVILDKSDQKILGSTAFGNFSDRDSRIEIGWTFLGKEYHGKGYNLRVKQLMLTHCFEEMKLERVEFKTDVLNLPARKALDNIHAIQEGVLRSHTLMSKNRRRDTLYYSILKEEWAYVKRENNW